MTLPLIYTLNKVDKSTRQKIITIVKNNNNDRAKVQWVLDTVKEAGGISYAIEKMYTFKQEALNILDTCPDNEYKRGLIDLVNYVTERKY